MLAICPTPVAMNTLNTNDWQLFSSDIRPQVPCLSPSGACPHPICRVLFPAHPWQDCIWNLHVDIIFSSALLVGLGNEKKMYLSLSRLPIRARIERFGNHVPGKRSCSRMSNTQECLARKRGGEEPTWNRKSGFGFSSDHSHVAWTCSLTWCDMSWPGSLFRLASEPQNGFPAVRDPSYWRYYSEH